MMEEDEVWRRWTGSVGAHIYWSFSLNPFLLGKSLCSCPAWLFKFSPFYRINDDQLRYLIPLILIWFLINWSSLPMNWFLPTHSFNLCLLTHNSHRFMCSPDNCCCKQIIFFNIDLRVTFTADTIASIQ